ncbi:MAG: GLUG motif-containing protein, partial [Clostridia bacterium]|nr:GLUG motif-containing protein [Clostridia bacterium]
MLVSILGIPLAKPQQVSATETSDPKYLSSITMDATASSSWDTNYDTALYATLTGSGYTNSYKTEATALQISSATQLAAFARAVNVGKKNFSGKYVKLTANIDLGGTNPTVTKKVDESDSSKFSISITDSASNVWVPIGNSTTNFKGTFNGDGHEVSNMTVIASNTSSRVYAGLFGYVYGGSIKNTGVTGNVYVSSSSSVYAGGLAGYSVSSSSISNSYATGNVYASSSSTFAGGLAGYNSDSSISNSYATGDVYASSSSSSDVYAGGLAGISYSNISNSYAT